MTRAWRDVRRTDIPEDMLAEAREAVQTEDRAYQAAIARLHRARRLTQAQLAQSLGMDQAELSRLEHQADLLVSTLARYMEALGAELSVTVTFEAGQTATLTMTDLMLRPAAPEQQAAD